MTRRDEGESPAFRWGCLSFSVLFGGLFIVAAVWYVARQLRTPSGRTRVTLEELIAGELDGDALDLTVTDYQMMHGRDISWEFTSSGRSHKFPRFYVVLRPPVDDGSRPIRAVLETGDELPVLSGTAKGDELVSRLRTAGVFDAMLVGRGRSELPEWFTEDRVVDDDVVVLEYGTTSSGQMWLVVGLAVLLGIPVLVLGILVFRSSSPSRKRA